MAPRILARIPAIDDYAEPFTGGGSVALAVARKHPEALIALNDADWWVSCFWSVIIGEEEGFQRLVSFSKVKPSIDEFWRRRDLYKPQRYELRRSLCPKVVEAACNALFFNRTTFSGIFSSGPMGGVNQAKNDLAMRWHKSLSQDLAEARSLLKGRTRVECVDFEKFIDAHPNSFLYEIHLM